MTLLSVIVALGIMSIVAVIFAQMTAHGIQGQNSVSLRGDAELMRLTILRNTDCGNTLKDVTCNASNFNLVLKDKNGKFVNGLAIPAPVTSGAFAGSRPLANSWHVRAACDPTTNTINVQVAKKSGSTYALDPLTKLPLDFTKKNHQLFSAGGTPLCSAFFDGPTTGCVTTCGANERITKVDFANQCVYCEQALAFGGMYATWSPTGSVTCAYKNPLTGGCSCPSGHVARQIHQWNTTCNPASPSTCLFYGSGVPADGQLLSWNEWYCSKA